MSTRFTLPELNEVMSQFVGRNFNVEVFEGDPTTLSDEEKRTFTALGNQTDNDRAVNFMCGAFMGAISMFRQEQLNKSPDKDIKLQFAYGPLVSRQNNVFVVQAIVRGVAVDRQTVQLPTVDSKELNA